MSEPKRTQARWVLPVASVVTFLAFLDTPLLLPILALYASELGASMGVVGLVIGLYSLTNTPANILFGRLIDRVGHKLPLTVGLIGDALSMFLYSVTRLPIHLALVRALHGTTGALLGPATMSATAEYGGEMGKGRVMGFYGIALASATLVGFGLSGVLASRLGYPAVFLFGTAMLTVGVILSLLLPDRRRSEEVARVAFGESLARARDLFRRRGLIVAYSAIFAQYFTFGGVVTLLPLYVKRLGMEVFHVGMLLAIFAVMFILLQFPSGRLSDRVGRLKPTAIGLSLGIISLVMLSSVAVFPLLAVATALYGVAYGLLFPSISALVVEHTALGERGLATGMFHALLTAGVAIGAPVMGWAGEMAGVRIGLAFNAGIMLLALLIALGMAKKTVS